MRFDVLKARLQNEVFAVEPNFADAVSVGLNDPQAASHTNIANDGVTYQVVGNAAVIAVDGAMYKKNLSGMCMSVASYDQIVKAIDTAEADEDVERIIFRVDTPGGSVAGADEVRDRILSTKKETITYYENIGASAGMWIFTASDKIYASEMTTVGSIGVIVVYQEPKEKTLAIVSSSAPNKYCDIQDDGCKKKIQSRLDEYEAMFYDRLVSRFDKTREQIAEDFNHGATIFARDAHKLGYLDGVMEFRELLEEPLPAKTKESEIMPQGAIMNEEQLRSEHPELVAAIEAAATQGLQDQINALTAQAEARATMTENVVAMAKEMGASIDALGEALKQDDEVRAENVLRKAVMSEGAVTTGESKTAPEEQPIMTDKEVEQLVEDM